jgi:hypothetical protein
MMVGIGSSLNQMDTRVETLEQGAMRATSGRAQVYLDPTTGATIVEDQLDWAPAANLWESYTTFGPTITDPEDPDYLGNPVSTVYGRPEANLIGSTCLLTGMVRRKAGSTNLTANTRYDQPMFALPAEWRPESNVILPCIMGNANPDPAAVPGPPANTFGTAWIEIRPENNLTAQHPSGRVYFVMGTLALTAGVGWISLQGIFPCTRLNTTAALVEGGWNEVPITLSWNEIGENVTWDTYPSGITPP